MTEHRPEEERRGEDAAHRPRADRQRRDHETQREQRHDQLDAPGPIEEGGDRLAPVAHDLRIAQRDQPEHEARRRHGQGPRQPRARVEGGARAQGEQEAGGGQAAEHAERGVEADLPGGRERESGHVEHGIAAEGGPGQERRGRGRHRDRRERLEREAAENDLHREECGAQGRVVGAGEPGGDAAGHEPAPLPRRDAKAPPDGRSRGCGHEHDRPLSTDGSRRGLGDERGGRPRDRGAQGQHAVAQHDRLQDVPPARPARPARAEREDQPGEESTDRRDRHAGEGRRQGHPLHQAAPRPDEPGRLGGGIAEHQPGRAAEQADRERAQQNAGRLRDGKPEGHDLAVAPGSL